MVRRQKRYPRGFNENLYNIQSAQNKPINESLLPGVQFTEISEQPSGEGGIKRWELDGPGCIPYLEKTEERRTSILLPSHSQLLRRPKANTLAMLKEKDLHLKIFTKQLIFKDRNFPPIENQFIYYLMNFPLLFEEKKKGVRVIKQNRTPQHISAISPELKHGILMKYRLFNHRRDLKELENEEPGVFETELWDDVFDPTTWDCNNFSGRFTVRTKTREKQGNEVIHL